MTTPLPPENRHCPFCGGMVAPKIEYCTHCAYDLPPEEPAETPPVRDQVLSEPEEAEKP